MKQKESPAGCVLVIQLLKEGKEILERRTEAVLLSVSRGKTINSFQIGRVDLTQWPRKPEITVVTTGKEKKWNGKKKDLRLCYANHPI